MIKKFKISDTINSIQSRVIKLNQTLLELKKEYNENKSFYTFLNYFYNKKKDDNFDSLFNNLSKDTLPDDIINIDYNVRIKTLPQISLFITFYEEITNLFPIIPLDFYSKYRPLDYFLDSDFTFRSKKKIYYRRIIDDLDLDDSDEINISIDILRKLNRELYDLLSEIEELEEIPSSVNQLITEFQKCFNGLYYIGPIRLTPERYYLISGESFTDVGLRGENVPTLLREAILMENYNVNKKKIEEWLGKFNMAKKTSIEEISDAKDLISIIFEEFYSGLNINLSDMGTGTSQVLPIIIEGFLIPKDSILCIEQPEIHLHPKAQADLGDLLIEIMQNDKTLIVETHSEPLFRRIQRRIAEGSVKHNEIAFYYVTMTEQGSNVERLELNEDGYFKEIPEGFFDQDFEESYNHLNAVMKKKQE